MPLGREVGLRSRDIVLHGHPTPPLQKKVQSPAPNFRPMSIVALRLDASRCHFPPNHKTLDKRWPNYLCFHWAYDSFSTLVQRTFGYRPNVRYVYILPMLLSQCYANVNFV